jgi:hypothetical protein
MYRALLVWLITAAPAAAAPLCPDAAPPSASALIQAANRVPAAPHAVARLHTEGTLPHQGIYDESQVAQRDLTAMRDLALAWRMAGDRPALDRLAVYLSAWTATYKPSFDPIDETNFDGLIDAYALAAPDLPAGVREQARGFLEALAAGYVRAIDNQRGKSQGTWSNNWQSHRVKIETMAAVAIGDDALFARARAAFRRQLDQNVLPDGEVIDFHERDALHYVVYDLEPLTRAAIAAARHGEDWLGLPGKDGQTLRMALDWLLPYADGTKPHEEFVHTTVSFDLARRAAGVAGFAGRWPSANAAALYWSASLLDTRYLSLARTLAPAPPRWLWAVATCRR